MIIVPVLALAGIALAQTNVVTFDRDSLVTNDLFFHSEPVGLRLNKQPAGDVTVHLSSSSAKIRSDKCMLKFTPSNWNTSQQFVLNAAASLVASSNNNVSVILEAPFDADLHKKEQFLRVCHEPKDRRACSSLGDPHYSTFDGKGFDSMSEGLLTLVKNDRLTIQVLQFKCHKTHQITCNSEVAIRYMNTFIYWKVSREYNQSTISGLTVEQFGSTAEVRQTKLSSNAYRFTLSDGSDVELSTAFWPAGLYWYTNIAIYLGSSYKRRVSGMCGNYNDNATDDWDPVKTFPENAVPDAQDYRFCKSRCPSDPWNDRLLGSVCTPPTINSFSSSVMSPSSTEVRTSTPAIPQSTPCTTSLVSHSSSTLRPSSSSVVQSSSINISSTNSREVGTTAPTSSGKSTVSSSVLISSSASVNPTNLATSSVPESSSPSLEPTNVASSSATTSRSTTSTNCISSSSTAKAHSSTASLKPTVIASNSIIASSSSSVKPTNAASSSTAKSFTESQRVKRVHSLKNLY